MITSGDRDDIQLGFDSLDIDVNGFLSMENVHALFLGLGYANEVDTYVSIDSLRKLAGRDALNLEETMELFGKFKRFEKGEHRRSHWQSVFHAVVGESTECTASHIQELCRQYGMEDIDITQAQRILLSIKAKDGRVNRLRQLNEHELRQTLSEEEFLCFVNKCK